MGTQASPSISKKLMLMLLFTSSVALLLSASGFIVNDWFSLRSTMFDRLRTEAGFIGNNSVTPMTFGDKDAATRALSILKHKTDVVAAALFARDGKLFAEYQRENRALSLTLPQTKSGTLDGGVFAVSPILRDNKKIGSMLLISDLNYWKERQLLNLLTALGVLLLSFIVALVLSNRLQRWVSEPILKLAETARRITEDRNYGLRAEKLSKDEIGRLVDDFNGMLKQIQLRDQELHQSQERLEEKVQTRTKELTELTRQLEHQAYHDTLTGLANRGTFDDHLQLAIKQSLRHEEQLAVLFLDLDRFKVINDTLGHAVGDKLLVQVASRFADCVRSGDTLARLGGDEFGVLLLNIKQSIDASKVAEKLAEAISEPFNVNGYSLHLSSSVGISLFPADGTNAELILKNADTAMYRSKDLGRNQISFFSQEMNDRAARRLALENKLRVAVRERRLMVYYQPRFDTKSLEMTGVEALIRWFDPDEGQITPEEFIPLAEECGLIANIDEWTLETACQEVLEWFGGQTPDISLAVNLSPAQFIRKDLHAVIAGILEQTGYPGSRLEMEITESMFGPDTEDAYSIFEKLGELGIKIAVDDFGTAYSSLSRLKQLPLHILKIDKSFVRDLGKDSDDETIVRTIITMANNLNLKVIAEGVENDLQYEFVKKHGCDAIQGFLFGKPVRGSEIKKLLASANDQAREREAERVPHVLRFPR